MGAVTLHDFRYAGEYASSKLNRVPSRKPARRRAGDLRSPRGGLGLQHPRQRRGAYATAALLRHRDAGRASPRSMVDSAKLSNAVRHNLEEIANIREPADFIRKLTAFELTGKTVRLDPGDRGRRARPHRGRPPAAR